MNFVWLTPVTVAKEVDYLIPGLQPCNSSPSVVATYLYLRFEHPSMPASPRLFEYSMSFYLAHFQNYWDCINM